MAAPIASLTRWIAYDATVDDHDNIELEPGNTNTRTCKWSNERKTNEIVWSGYASSCNESSREFRTCALTERTFSESNIGGSTIDHTVYFMPHEYMQFPPSLPATSSASIHGQRMNSIASILDHLPTLDSMTLDPYARFRLLWILARGGVLPRTPDQLASLTTHTNLFAPIITHDHKAFVSKVIQKMTPVSDESSSSSYTRQRAAILPQIPFVCDITDPRAMMIELLQTMVHTQLCYSNGWSLDGRSWQSDHNPTGWMENYLSSWNSSVNIVMTWIQQHLAQRSLYLDFVLRCFRELMPPATLLRILDTCFPIDWKDLSFQQGFFRRITEDSVSSLYPPSIDHRCEFWKTLATEIEQHGSLEVDGSILRLLQECTKEKSGADLSKPLPSHWTVTYRPSTSDADQSAALSTCTLRLERGFSSTTGCSLWPAGMLMCEFILANRSIFAGKRVLALGVGIGLDAIMVYRAGVASLICTDCDEKALRNLHVNFSINDVPVAAESASAEPFGAGVHIANLDWCSPDRSLLIRRASPDVIIACDTIYLPEFHDALGTVVLESLQCGVKNPQDATGSSSESTASDTPTIYPCAYFAQMNRNPETFAHYIETFGRLGLHVERQTEIAATLPSRFAYDRDAIEFHRFTLPKASV